MGHLLNTLNRTLQSSLTSVNDSFTKYEHILLLEPTLLTSQIQYIYITVEDEALISY